MKLFSKTSLLETPKFVLSVGDEGAILTYIRGHKLELRIFASLSQASELKNMQRVLAEDTKAPIYLLVDVLDQSYTHHSLPAVSALTINNLVKRRLERDFPEEDIKGSIYLNRAQSGRKDWNYIFVSCPVVPPLSQWLDFLLELPHQLAGLYLLPIETTKLLKQLNGVFFPEKTNLFKPKQIVDTEKPVKSAWQLFISHNKVGGIRQIAFKGEKIIFTRMIHIQNDLLPDIIAGHIEQELLNSVEYLKRLSLKEGEAFDTYVIVSQEIKRSLETSRLPGKNILLLTPFEIATHLKLENAATPEDRFADVVMAVNFANQRPVLPLFTLFTKKLLLFNFSKRWIRLTSIVLTPLLLFYMALMTYEIFSVKKETLSIQQQKLVIETRWKEFQKENYSMEDTAKISDVIALYKILSGDNLSPLGLVHSFREMKFKGILVKSIDWRLKNSRIAQASAEEANVNKMAMTLELEFHTMGGSFEDLFENFDRFISQLKSTFYGYEVEYSRLPDRINFTNKASTIPLQVTITGPKKNVRSM